MTNRRTLTWSMAMRDSRGERMPRATIREERLRSTAGLSGAERVTSWRGASGRRYVVGVHPAGSSAVEELTEAVVLAVTRGRDGEAHLLDVATTEPGLARRSRLRWLALMRVRGATELHVHLLAESEAERDAVKRDLAVGEGGALEA